MKKEIRENTGFATSVKAKPVFFIFLWCRNGSFPPMRQLPKQKIRRAVDETPADFIFLRGIFKNPNFPR